MIFVAEKEDFGKRIDNLVAERSDMSRSAIQKLIKSGAVKINSAVVTDKSCIVKEGDTVEMLIPEPESIDVAAEDIPLDIVYEDADLLVVNKPKGMVVHPAPGNYS